MISNTETHQTVGSPGHPALYIALLITRTEHGFGSTENKGGRRQLTEDTIEHKDTIG